MHITQVRCTESTSNSGRRPRGSNFSALKSSTSACIPALEALETQRLPPQGSNPRPGWPFCFSGAYDAERIDVEVPDPNSRCGGAKCGARVGGCPNPSSSSGCFFELGKQPRPRGIGCDLQQQLGRDRRCYEACIGLSAEHSFTQEVLWPKPTHATHWAAENKKPS